jgi:acetyltransferase-like isoleucine patch superfamily enzyme
LLLISPILVSFWTRRQLLGSDRALEGSTQALALLPGVFGQYLRRAFLGAVLKHCHHTATISFGTIFSRTDACIDENVYIGPGCHIGLVHVERDVLIGAGVHLPSGPATHGTDDLSRPIREQQGSERLVRIGGGAWIGSAAVVMADVGHDTVVGAGAVVTRPLPPLVVAAGVPARPIKARQGQVRRAG